MKEFLVAAVILVVPIQALTVQVSHHHHAVYLMGGEGTASTTSPSGLFLYDRTGTTTTFKKLCDVPFFMTMPGCVRMDYDNKSILGCTLASSGSSRGERSLLRYHVDSKTWSTVLQLPYSTLAGGGNDFMLPWPPIVDQNGDYLLPVYRSTYERVPTTLSRKHYYVFRVDRNSGMASTLLTSLQLPRVQWAEFSRLTRDIESGKLLIGGHHYQSTTRTYTYPVWALNPEDGYRSASVHYWNDGLNYGWGFARRHLGQNVRSGYLEGLGSEVRRVYQLKPGTSGLTTLSTITGFPYYYPQGRNDQYDLQTAANPRYLSAGHASQLHATWIMHLDVSTWNLSTIDTVITTAEYLNPYSYQFDFYRGRHIQTVLTGPNKWDIRLSVPHHPGKSYVLVAGVSGVRPGLALPDGRNINLNPDVITYVTLANLLPGIWSSGPGTLDANGEAKGLLDMSTLSVPPNGLGLPLWIAMAVTDPQAPGGLAYLPDTYVMRL